MSGKLNWDRCRPRRATEAKYSPGHVLPNGAITTGPRKDSLAYRADRALRKWQRTLSPQDRQKLSGATGTIRAT
jgi:hypothetical protein